MTFGASCAALLSPQVSLALAPRSESAPLLAIADRRYSDSLRFADAIGRAGGEIIEIGSDIGEEEIKRMALERPNIRRHLDGKQVVREVVVPGKLVNFVVR